MANTDFDTGTDAVPFLPPSTPSAPAKMQDRVPAQPATPSLSLDDLTGNTKAGQIGHDLAQKEYVLADAESVADATRKRKDAQYDARMEHMLSVESATANELKPWNASEELAKRQTSLWDQFGSPGFIVAMIGSAFTAMPMNSALNAGAAAMNAINEGNMEDYNKSFAAWQKNTELVEKRLDIENRAYEQIDKLRSRNMEEWRSEMAGLLARFNHTRGAAMLDAGLDSELLSAQQAQAQLPATIAKTREALIETKALTDALYGHPDPNGDHEDAAGNKFSGGDPRWYKGTDMMGAYTDARKKLEEAKRAGMYGRGSNVIPPELQKQLDASDSGAPTDETAEDSRLRHNQIMADFWRSKNPVGVDRNRIAEEHNQTMADLTSRKIDVTEAKNREDALHKQNMDDLNVAKFVNQAAKDQARTAEIERHNKAKEEIDSKKLTASGGGAPTKEKEIARRVAAFKAANPNATDKQLDDAYDAAAKDVAGAHATVKNFSNPEQKVLSVVPELMKHLETLDAFSSATGTISGLVQRLGAEYGGVNDPAIIWQTAKRQAEAAVAELASGGRVSVVGLKAQLEQLPDDYKAARFGKYQVQQFMRDLRDKAQSELDIMEASGKKVPPEVLDKFAAIGVYPASLAAKDPLLQLREDPSKVPTDQLTAMSRYMSALPLEDQRRIVAEAKRRLNAAQGGQ